MSTNHKKNRAALLGWGLITLGLAGVVVACEGGKAGDKCSTNNDCNTSLICQPVEGRDSDYCCPSEGPEQTGANVPTNCQPVGSGTGSSTGSGSGTSPPVEDAAADG
jgi:hypothetical protein